ncbi:SDR family NAD(P)-dependent oxidoreductase [Parafrankia sp. FMc2]|uniref:SDR family NAD(P)-dependent oxidoreductase n=1 Tax=Parafrankia sp. FMc2 TaxID=3233196 RepID=UPI0034D5128F
MTRLDDSAIPDYPGLLRLDGRVALVVGAGQGNGRHTAHALASVGAKVACVDLDPGLAREIAAEVGGLACVADVRARDAVERIVAETLAAFGRIDVVVDIVGMALWGSLLDSTDEDWDTTFGLVLRHAQLLTQIVGRQMVADGGGAMVFIASVSGLTSAPNHAAYGAAKAGLLSLVRTAAVELGPSNIRVNAIAPGAIQTPRILRAVQERGDVPLPPSIEPLGHPGQPRDIASAALFLCSDLSLHVTGHTLVVDGGASARFVFMGAGLPTKEVPES